MSDGFEYKQGLIVRLDLKMGRGKIAVQCAHAAVSAAEEARLRFPEWWKHWIEEGQAKIALKVSDLDSILRLEFDAKSDRKSTRLNSSHVSISYAVFCLK